MGHQVRFYATPADIEDLQKAITADESVLILHRRSPTAKPRVVSSLNTVEAGHRWLFYALVREEDLGGVITTHVPVQGYWSIDELRSPAIELGSCYFDGQVLREGRLSYVDGFYGADGAWVEKPEAFRTWAKGVFKRTKKALRLHGSSYMGRDALGWLRRTDGKLIT